MELSKRLSAVAGLVTPGLVVADVGTDHGYIPIFLLESGKCEKAFAMDVNYLYALVYGAVGSAAGVFGDLCFSVVKRQTGIKDYGKLIPGHGGVLDRFDSMMMVGPLMEALLILIPMAV